MPVKYTNKHNLPQSFVNAIIQNDHVTAGDISVTQLIDAPQIRQLKKLHTYEVDVMDLIGMAMGTGMHTVLERGDLQGTFDSRLLQRAAGILMKYNGNTEAEMIKKFISENIEELVDQDIIVEQLVTMEIEGWTISGHFDRYEIPEKWMQDYKNTGATAVMFPEYKKMWDAQMNSYILMFKSSTGRETKRATIIAVLKDWSKMKILSNKDYPKTPVIIHDIKIIEEERMMKYMSSRVRLHQRADAGEVIECTPKDRWANPDTWAVKLKGGKRALKKCLSESQAEAYIQEHGFRHSKPLEIEYRPAESFRCANGYCPVADVCPQYKKEKELAALRAEEI